MQPEIQQLSGETNLSWSQPSLVVKNKVCVLSHQVRDSRKLGYSYVTYDVVVEDELLCLLDVLENFCRVEYIAIFKDVGK
jgi:hypothetical protein